MLTTALGVVLVLASDPERVKLTAKELKKLQGTWEVVAVEARGNRTEIRQELPAFAITFEGTRFAVNGTGGRAVIDPTTDPKLIDLRYTKEGVTLETIYRIDGDTLTICYRPFLDKVKNRPADFKTDEKSEYEVRVYRRKKQ